MARFLITVWPLSGHVYPNLALATALRDRGHTVAFYTGARARAAIEREGFTYLPFKALDGEILEEIMAPGYLSAPTPWHRVRRQKAIYREWLVGTLPGQLVDLEEILRTWQPDAIICDPTMWGPILVLHEAFQAPVAVFSYTVGCLLPGRDVPPPGPGLPPPRNARDRLRAAAYGIAQHLATADIRRAANEIRRRYGLPPLRVTVTEHAGTMPLYLVTSVPELDYNRDDLPPNVHYVGPCLWSRPASEPPTWMDELPSDQPWVHVTEGTLHNQRPLLLWAAAQGLADLPVQVIMATGTHRRPEDLGLGPLAPNIHVKAWVSYPHLLPRTAVVVTAGGAGTVLATLQAGVPMVVVPTEWDKPENAQRVVESGAGLRLNPKRCTPTRLRSAVERILRDPSFRENAQRLARRFTQYGGPRRAAQLLEEMVI
ncbi:MAG TPA: glycosyltransferase [Caldilineae bacterium]|nr:glycosyltransferase [Caldilineae bacterium]